MTAHLIKEILTRKRKKGLYSKKGQIRSLSAAMRMDDDSRDKELAERAIRLRKALGFDTSADFARALGVSNQRWNMSENGHLLSIQVAKKIVRHFPGVTLDWIYNGVRAGLSYDMAVKLDAVDLPEAMPVSSGRRGTRPKAGR